MLVLENVPNLEKELVQELKRATLREYGCMMYDLDAAWRSWDGSHDALIAYSDKGKVMGWALLSHRWYQPAQLRGNIKYTDFQVYVKPYYRRKGVGTSLYRRARQIAGGRARLIVHPHDARSDRFFDKNHPSNRENK